MASNKIKRSGSGLGLQVTKPARAAALVEENADGEATYLAETRVFAFDKLLLVFDLERVSTADIAELVASAARDSKSIYRADDATMQIKGNGYMVALPPVDDAGFTKGEEVAFQAAPGMLAISEKRGEDAARVSRLAADIISHRNTQVGT